MKLINGFPRRSTVEHWTPLEKTLYETMQAIEAGPAHPLMTDALNLVNQARDKVADFVELEHEEYIPPGMHVVTDADGERFVPNK